MSFKSEYAKYCKAQKMAEESRKAILDFFSDLDLDYSVNYCAGDGVMLLDGEAELNAHLTEDDIRELSKAKTREQALQVISRLKFSY